THSLAPAALPGAAVTPTPAALQPDLVVQNGGVYLNGGRLLTFGSTAQITSTAIAPSGPKKTPPRVPSCTFDGSFTIRNAGGGPAPAVDVYTWFEQPQGPQVGKMLDVGYGNPALAPGGTQMWSFRATLMQGAYVFHLVIDPKRLNKQYALNLMLSCRSGGIAQMQAPNALHPGPQPLAAPPSGIAPSGGIGIARMGAHSFMQVEGVAGESNDLAHRGWIELLSASWRDEGADGSRSGCQRIRFAAAKLVDKSSAQLAGLAVSGRPTAITVDGPGGRRTLQRAMITSVTPSGGGERPQESVSATGSYCP
ncbi:MAG: type VI secretion system tube protein Hcp, partial [Burkholderiales bacterium]